VIWLDYDANFKVGQEENYTNFFFYLQEVAMQPVHCLRESSGRYIDNSHSLCHHHDHRLANFIINIQRSSWKT